MEAGGKQIKRKNANKEKSTGNILEEKESEAKEKKR